MIALQVYQRPNPRLYIVGTIIIVILILCLPLPRDAVTFERPLSFIKDSSWSKQDVESQTLPSASHQESDAALTSKAQEALDPCATINFHGEGKLPKHIKHTLVLVTGGAGFIGSNLVDRLLSLGYHVRILDNLYTGYLRNVPLHNNNVQFILGDIMDPQVLKEAVDGVKFVFHLAAMSKVLPSVKNPDMARFCVESNALGTWNVLNAVRNRGDIAKVIYAASSTYYGNNPPPHREDQAGDFLTPYAASKYEGEIQMQMFDRLFGVPTVSTRFFMVYGPRQPSTGAYAIVTGVFAKQAAEEKPLTIEGDGTHYRDFIHVNDIVTGLILAQQSSKVHGETINLGSGSMHSVKELADIVSPKQVHVDPRPNDLEGTLADTCKMKKILGYKAETDFEENMRYLAHATMEGNVFMQPWLTPQLALSAPHLLPPSAAMFSWPRDRTDLDALLHALGQMEANATGTSSSFSKSITVVPFLTSKPIEHALNSLLLNTIFSLVKHAGVQSYIVTVISDEALSLCDQQSLPCLDVRGQSHQQVIYSLISRGHDVHYAQLGNSYFKPIATIFDMLAGADAYKPDVVGDLFIHSSEQSREAFGAFAAKDAKTKPMSASFSLPTSLRDMTAQSYPVQRLCDGDWSVGISGGRSSGSQHQSRKFSEWQCSSDFFAAVACNAEQTLESVNATISLLKENSLWHLTSCEDSLHCDIQQVVPKVWVMRRPDLKPFDAKVVKGRCD